MEVNSGARCGGATHAARTGEHKSSSPDVLQIGAHTPAGAGDITPTQSRTGSPFNFLSLQSALSGSSTSNSDPSAPDTQDAAVSVDHSSDTGKLPRAFLFEWG